MSAPEREALSFTVSRLDTIYNTILELVSEVDPKDLPEELVRGISDLMRAELRLLGACVEASRKHGYTGPGITLEAREWLDG